MKSEAALCSDDDWVHKCPSGCRLHGLISRSDADAQRRLWKVCETMQIYEDAAEKGMTAMTHIYSYNRRVIVNTYMSELKFAEYADRLARNLTSLRQRSSTLSQQIVGLSRRVQKQVEDLYRTEVDVDMKLRACLGSCRLGSPFSVDHRSYQLLQTDVDRMKGAPFQKWKTFPPHEEIPRIKLKPVDAGLAPNVEYRSIPVVGRELLTQFEDIGQNLIVLEEGVEIN